MEQHYGNHRRFVPGFHFLASSLILACIVLAIVYLAKYSSGQGALLLGIILLVIPCTMALLFFYARAFALKAQDRAIRAEESLRHFVLTQQLPDPKLRLSQLIALRFAHNDEYLALLKRALDENLDSNSIKKAIKQWRADHHRA